MARAKKLTRAEAKRQANIESLKKRLIDIANGAYGPYMPLDYEGDAFSSMPSELGLGGFAHWLGGIRNSLLRDRDEKQQDLLQIQFLDRYNSIQSAAEFLNERGVKA